LNMSEVEVDKTADAKSAESNDAPVDPKNAQVDPKKKTVIKEGVTGKVKWYSFRKNYGFIQRDDDSQDVFVHQLSISKSRIRKPNLRTLGHNEKVQFDVVQGKKGFEASNVTGPDGTEVQGSRIIFIFSDSYDRFNPRRLPYQDYGRRPRRYYDDYRRPAYRDRDFHHRDERIGVRYEDNRQRYPQNRERSYPANHDRYQDTRSDRPYRNRDRSYRDEKNVRQPYRGRRRSYNHDQDEKNKPNDEKVEVKKAVAANNNNTNDNKMKTRRPRRLQFNRRHKKLSEGATPAQSETSVKDPAKAASGESETSVKDLAKAASGDYVKDKQHQDLAEDVVKGVAEMKVSE